MQNTTNRLRHLITSTRSLTRKSEESNIPTSKKKAYTPVQRKGKDTDQESSMGNKNTRGSPSRQKGNTTDIISKHRTPVKMVSHEKPSQQSLQNISRGYNQV